MRQFAWFDCLRCAAIFLVMLAHCGDFSKALPPTVAVLFNDAQLISWVGVELFFVLSGFLVSGLLFVEHDRTGSLDIGRFLVRRAFKIIPPFYFLVLVTSIYDLTFRGSVNLTHLFHDIFFLQNYRAGAWPHAWTLALEVHFYLLLALLLFYLARRSPKGSGWLRRLPSIICWVLLASFLARFIHSSMSSGYFNMHRDIEPSHLHLDVLAAGVLLRYLYNYHPERLRLFQRGRLLWIGLGLLLVWPSKYIWSPHPALLTALVPSCNYLGFGLVVFEATQFSYPASGIGHWLLKPFDFFGKHSYSIYLWHLPVLEWLVAPLVKERGLLFFVLFFGGSLVIGSLFSILLEEPVLHLRNRLFPSNAQPRRQAEAALGDGGRETPVP
jgi:peptidoglycan/LPS O-acetylase OafA/YrhL